MAKIVYRNLQRGPVKGALRSERVVDANGQTKRIYTLKADSRHFGDNLRAIFEKNVIKARRANKTVSTALGSRKG